MGSEWTLDTAAGLLSHLGSAQLGLELEASSGNEAGTLALKEGKVREKRWREGRQALIGLLFCKTPK